jgi:alpha,alpha-trehalase
MSTWHLTYDTFDPAEEGLREALCALGNGYFVTRGAAPESRADGVHYPGTYLAGGYNRLQTQIAGEVVENEDLVNFPNWQVLDFRVQEDEWFGLDRVELLEFRQELDLRGGVLHRTVRFVDGEGRRTRLAQRRFVHMRDPHLAGLETTVVAENWSGRLEVRSALDGTVINDGVARYRDLDQRHLRPLEQGEVGDDIVYLQVETVQSRRRVALAARTRLGRNGAPAELQRRAVEEEEGFIAHLLGFELAEGEPVTVEKVVALHSSKDPAIAEAGLAARERAGEVGGFDELLASHRREWYRLWDRFDIRLDGPDRAQLILRLHQFHLLQTASANTIEHDVGVPARGWHGEAYRGHIFWDEMFVFPVLTTRLPALTRSLLNYRYRRLGAARRAAAAAGHEGALYPWQSGSDGREESQRLHLNPKSGRWLPDNSHLQRHIGIAVAYNVWQYYESTADMEFLRWRGAEILLESARFWASLATYDRSQDRWEIRGVMGPDEYHDAYPDADEPGLDNNAYTNVMAVWVLRRALQVGSIVPVHHREELWERLSLQREELEHWEELGRKMLVPFHGDRIISQFSGYDALEEFDWEGYRQRYGDIARLDRILEAEGDTTNRYKLSKQADVLMLFYLLPLEELRGLLTGLGYEWDEELIRRNTDYYLRRTSHGSTLSNMVSSWVLSHLDRANSWKYFTRALESDVSDIQGGTTAEGIHLGAMAGTVDLVQRCYGGVETHADVLRFNPALPEELDGLHFTLHYRGQRVQVDITPQELRLETRPGPAAPIQVAVGDDRVELAAGASLQLPLPLGGRRTTDRRSG